MVEYYALMCANGTMRPAETIPGMGRESKEQSWRGEFNYDIL
jgi:hypothetical protein